MYFSITWEIGGLSACPGRVLSSEGSFASKLVGAVPAHRSLSEPGVFSVSFPVLVSLVLFISFQTYEKILFRSFL